MAWANTHSTDLESTSSQYWSVADHANFDFSTTFSFSLWLKLESQPGTDLVMGLINKRTGVESSYTFQYFDESGVKKIRLGVCADANCVTNDAFDITQTLSNATWYHLAVTWNGATKTAKIYINGTQTGGDLVGVNVATILNSTASLAIGASTGGGSYFDGLIDDVRLWARVLSGSEITSLYSDSGGFSNGANLMALWKFDNAATDSSGNGHTLTGSGSPTYSTDIKWTYNSFAEVLGIAVEAITVLPTFTIPTIADIAGVPIESVNPSFGWVNTNKSSTSWTNLSKS